MAGYKADIRHERAMQEKDEALTQEALPEVAALVRKFGADVVKKAAEKADEGGAE